MNPVQVFAEWYRRQEPHVKSDVETFVGYSAMPKPESEQESAKRMLNGSACFNEWLEGVEKSERGFISQRLLIGHAVMLRGLVTLLVFQHRKKVDDFEAINERRADLEKAMGPDWGHSSLFEPMKPEEIQLWIDAAQSWEQLCNSSLSDEAIDAWIDEQRFKGFAEGR